MRFQFGIGESGSFPRFLHGLIYFAGHVRDRATALRLRKRHHDEFLEIANGYELRVTVAVLEEIPSELSESWNQRKFTFLGDDPIVIPYVFWVIRNFHVVIICNTYFC